MDEAQRERERRAASAGKGHVKRSPEKDPCASAQAGTERCKRRPVPRTGVKPEKAEKRKMPRLRKFPRMSTGGKAPRGQGPYGQEGKKVGADPANLFTTRAVNARGQDETNEVQQHLEEAPVADARRGWGQGLTEALEKSVYQVRPVNAHPKRENPSPEKRMDGAREKCKDSLLNQKSKNDGSLNGYVEEAGKLPDQAEPHQVKVEGPQDTVVDTAEVDTAECRGVEAGAGRHETPLTSQTVEPAMRQSMHMQAGKETKQFEKHLKINDDNVTAAKDRDRAQTSLPRVLRDHVMVDQLPKSSLTGKMLEKRRDQAPASRSKNSRPSAFGSLRIGPGPTFGLPRHDQPVTLTLLLTQAAPYGQRQAGWQSWELSPSTDRQLQKQWQRKKRRESKALDQKEAGEEALNIEYEGYPYGKRKFAQSENHELETPLKKTGKKKANPDVQAVAVPAEAGTKSLNHHDKGENSSAKETWGANWDWSHLKDSGSEDERPAESTLGVKLAPPIRKEVETMLRNKTQLGWRAKQKHPEHPYSNEGGQ